MASQKDPQTFKNLTKSEKWMPQTPFEGSFARFHFRKGFQVVPRDLQNLEIDCFTKVTLLFSEIHSSLKMVSLGHLLEAFGTFFPPMSSLMHTKIGKKDHSQKQQKTIKFQDPSWLQNGFQNGVPDLTILGSGTILVPIRFLTRPRPLFWSRLGHMCDNF